MWIRSRSFLPQSKDVHTGLTSSSRLSAGLDGRLFKSHLYLCAADVCGFASPILSPASCTMTRLSGFVVTARVGEAAARYVGGCAVSWSQSERVAWRPNPWPLILGSGTSQTPPLHASGQNYSLLSAATSSSSRTALNKHCCYCVSRLPLGHLITDICR